MIKRFFFSALSVAALSVSVPATAGAVTDCPLRDASFSIKSPMIDLLLNKQARAILNRVSGGKIDQLPPIFMGTTTPSFASILTFREAAAFGGMPMDGMDALDAELQAIPVSDDDKVARCVRYDNDVPAFSAPKGKPRLLLFEKINGFKDVPSVDAARAALTAMAARKGWSIVTTDKGGAFNTKTLKSFDAVIWNNISGDVLTLAQRKAFQSWMEKGGGFAAVHGSAGDPVYFWDWYADTLLGARFAGHPRNPQFQEARIAVDHSHPLSHRLPHDWKMTDEWYSFKTNPRTRGAKVLLTIDESSYNPNDPQMPGLVMGADHPMAWTNCVGKGRMFYSAIGHRPETYSQPQHVTMLEDAITWVATAKKACPAR